MGEIEEMTEREGLVDETGGVNEEIDEDLDDTEIANTHAIAAIAAISSKPLDEEKARKVVEGLHVFGKNSIVGSTRRRVPTDRYGMDETGTNKKRKILEQDKKVPDVSTTNKTKKGVFPTVYVNATRSTVVTYKTIVGLPSADFDWREEVKKIIPEGKDTDIVMEGMLVEVTRLIREDNPRDSDLLFWHKSGGQRKLGSPLARAHCITCPIPFLEKDDVNEEGGTVLVPYFKDPGDIPAVISYACCTNIWVKGLDVGTFKNSWYFDSATHILNHKLLPDLHPMITGRFKEYMERPVFARVYTEGFTVLDLKGLLLDNVSDWLDKTLVRYAEMSESGSGIPDFRPITDRKHAFRLDGSESYPFPLKASARLQLYLSDEYIKETLPNLYEYLLDAMGSRKMLFSLLYSEGPNYLRLEKSFLQALKSAKKTLPNKILTVTDINELLGEEKASEFLEGLRQSAHKDTVKGYFSKIKEYTPSQMVCALTDPAKIFVWEKNGSAVLNHWDTGEEWENEEPGKGYNKKVIELQPGSALWFHSQTTHAGAGFGPSFRLFVGSVCTPEGFYIEPDNQSYFEMDKKEEFGGYRQIFDYISEDPDYSDKTMYPKYFKEGTSTVGVTRPHGTGNLAFYDLLEKAWDRVLQSRC